MAMSRSEYRDAAEKTKALARQENNKRKRILVVEDDQINLALLKQLLQVHGCEILETPEG
jgi:PleD family two-component response regulator